MSDLGAASDLGHSGTESGELSIGRISNWMVRLLSLTEKIMSKANSREFASDELTESELDQVSGGEAVAVWNHLLGQYGFPYTGSTGGFSGSMNRILSGVCEA
jgi:bacteriocin-like protein